jgi:hypothetical protein
MSDAASMLQELSLPWGPGERIKTIIDRAARLAHLKYSRTYEIWYRRARRIEPHEMQQITEALQAKKERAARNELHDLKLRLAKLEAALNAGHADFSRGDIDGHSAQAAHVGGSNSARRF